MLACGESQASIAMESSNENARRLWARGRSRSRCLQCCNNIPAKNSIGKSQFERYVLGSVTPTNRPQSSPIPVDLLLKVQVFTAVEQWRISDSSVHTSS